MLSNDGMLGEHALKRHAQAFRRQVSSQDYAQRSCPQPQPRFTRVYEPRTEAFRGRFRTVLEPQSTRKRLENGRFRLVFGWF